MKTLFLSKKTLYPILFALPIIFSLPASAQSQNKQLSHISPKAKSYRSFIVKLADNKQANDTSALMAALSDVAAKSNLYTINPIKHVRKMALNADVIEFVTPLKPNEVDQFIRQLQIDKRFQYATPNYQLRLQGTSSKAFSNDPEFSNQWSLGNSAGGIDIEPAWKASISQGKGIVVAFIDGGYLPHPDINANIIPGHDFVGGDTPIEDIPHKHGLFVAGIIGARTNNQRDMAGIAYNAQLQPLRVIGIEDTSLSVIIDAISWAAGGRVPNVQDNQTPAQVINMSIITTPEEDEDRVVTCADPQLKILQDTINFAVSKGSVVVAGAGNFGSYLNYPGVAKLLADSHNISPAGCQNVITVAATNAYGGKAGYSSFGTVNYPGFPPAVTISAPGGEEKVGGGVLSLDVTNDAAGVAYSEGTSFASPHVAGTVALMQGAVKALGKPLLSPNEIKEILVRTARPLAILPAPGQRMGAGIVNPTAAIEEAKKMARRR